MSEPFHIEPIELIALRKLALVSKALSTMLKGEAGREQKCLADVLCDVLDRYEIATARPAAPAAAREG